MNMQDRQSNFLAKLTTKIDRQLEDLLPNDMQLRSNTTNVLVKWIAGDPTAAIMIGDGPVELVIDARRAVARLGRTLRWMTDDRRHHGQQASQVAAKALRGVRKNRLSYAALLGLTQKFRKLRHAHIRRNAEHIARIGGCEVDLLGGRAVARRITSERGLKALGREAGNCLAQRDNGRGYRKELRSGKSEFWRIDVVDKGKPTLLWVVSLDGEDGDVQEVGQARQVNLEQYGRDALLAFLVERVAAPVTSDKACVSLWQHGLCSELIAAHRDGRVKQHSVMMGAAPVRLEIGPNVLGAWMPGKGLLAAPGLILAAWLLRIPAPESPYQHGFAHLSEEDSGAGEEDEEYDLPGAMSFRQQQDRNETALRRVMRAICKRNTAVAAACLFAFAGAPQSLREDWFGPIVAEDVKEAA